MKYWINYLRSWAWKQANSKWAGWSVFICALADASFFPLPTLTYFIAVALLNIRQAYNYFLFGTFGTLIGAMAGYSVGYFAWTNPSGEFTGLATFFINNVPGFSENLYNSIQAWYVKWDFWILFMACFVPLPYKILAISSGVFNINLFIFISATLISQGIKYYLLALIIVKIGPGVKKLIETKLKPIAIIATVCVAIIIVMVKII